MVTRVTLAVFDRDAQLVKNRGREARQEMKHAIIDSNVPTNYTAEDCYRVAWHTWLTTQDDKTRQAMQQLMDDLQPSIASCPNDPRWGCFAKSLPGFLDFWERMQDECGEMTEKKFGDNESEGYRGCCN